MYRDVNSMTALLLSLCFVLKLLGGDQTGNWEDEVSVLHHDLMRLEMQLVDQLDVSHWSCFFFK